MWLVLPLCAIYHVYQLVVVAGSLSSLLTVYAFFILHDEIFPNVGNEDFIYLIMFGVFTTVFLLIFIHKIREANAKLEELAYYDTLTGAANRLLLKKKFDSLKDSKVDSIALLFIDMNGFKQINDTYGHEVGDLLLKGVVSRLNGVRATDLLCRLGGDEFVILLSNKNNQMLASLTAEIQSALEKPLTINHQTIKASASIGSSYTTEVANADLDKIIKEADKAMYKEKGCDLELIES